MSQNDDQNLECPLCMEPFEMDDFTFFPCTCGYQICRFCWHRIRTDENGLCPACRKPYPEDPADFKPLSVEEFQKIKSEKRQKDQQKKHKAIENRKYLADVRVVQKNLVFVVGLPPRLADPELLRKHHYFGKFGRIQKVVVNHNTTYAGTQGPSASSYVTYCKPEDALNAIQNVNNIQIDGRMLKASLGTTKYCSYFLKNQQCPKADCMYLHEIGDDAASFTKADMKLGKHQEYEKHLQDIYQISDNKKEVASPGPHKKSHSCKETWPTVPQNPKAAQAKESKTDKQNRSKYKYTQLDSPKRKIKGKPDDLIQSTVSYNNNKGSKKDDSFSKRSSRPRNLHMKNCVNTSQPPLQRTEGLPACRTTVSADKQLAVNEMNSRNVQKTLLHIGGQPVYNESMKYAEKSAGDCPSFPSSPTSSSSSSLFTPFGSLSSTFLSSSPSPPLHSGDHLSLSVEDTSHHEGSGDSSTSASPQNFINNILDRPQCVALSCVDSDKNLGSQLKTLSVSAARSSYLHPTPENVIHKNEQEALTDVIHSSTSGIQKPDDDLDFDPWEESNKGLGDLIAKEETVYFSCAASIPPGFSCRAQVPSHVPNPRITPPPGFIPLIPATKYDCSSGKQLVSGMATRSQFSPLPGSMVPLVNMGKDQDALQEDFKALFPNVKVTFGGSPVSQNLYHGGNMPSGENNWQPHETAATLSENAKVPVWPKTLNYTNNPDRFLNSCSYSAAMALRGQWPTSSLSPPPGFVLPSRPPANPFQHEGVKDQLKSNNCHSG